MIVAGVDNRRADYDAELIEPLTCRSVQEEFRPPSQGVAALPAKSVVAPCAALYVCLDAGLDHRFSHLSGLGQLACQHRTFGWFLRSDGSHAPASRLWPLERPRKRSHAERRKLSLAGR